MHAEEEDKIHELKKAGRNILPGAPLVPGDPGAPVGPGAPGEPGLLHRTKSSSQYSASFELFSSVKVLCRVETNSPSWSYKS